MRIFIQIVIVLTMLFHFELASLAVSPATTQGVDPNQKLETAWENLEKHEPWCSQAVLELASNPEQSVPSLKRHLRPLKIEQKDLDDLLHKVGSEDDKIWKPAFEDLYYFDPRLNESVETIFENATEPLQRQRLASIITGSNAENFKGKDVTIRKSGQYTYLEVRTGNSSSSWYLETKVSRLSYSHRQWAQADRALVVLQHVGTPAAFYIINQMATGHHAAQPTLIAQAALLQGGGPATTRPGDENKMMDGWWDDLQKEEPWCTKALLNFSSDPQRAVTFLKSHIEPLKIDAKDLDAALTALASEDDKIWKPAFEKLKYFDPRLNQSVQTLMDNATDPLQRERLAAILGNYDPQQWKGWNVSLQTNGDRLYLSFTQNNSSSMTNLEQHISQISKPGWTRVERSAVLLEHISSKPAIEVLAKIATGNQSAEPTKVAQAALDSLGIKQR